MKRAVSAGSGPAFLLLAVVAWEIVVRGLGDKATVFPPPSAILPVLAELAAGGTLWIAFLQTFYRLAAGFSIGLAAAVVLGLLMGISPAIYRLFAPLVELVRPIPKVALVPPLMFFLGLGDAMKIAVIALSVFFPILLNLVQGVRGIDPELLDAARTFGVSRARMLRRVVLPACLPQLMAGAQISLGVGLVAVILAEMVSAGGGIGFGVIDAQRAFRVKEMYAWVVATALAGYALNLALEASRARLLHWHRDLDAIERSALQE
jgi:ABC-type nitrate/sulfonate/bicarbonate transport system permease component